MLFSLLITTLCFCSNSLETCTKFIFHYSLSYEFWREKIGFDNSAVGEKSTIYVSVG